MKALKLNFFLKMAQIKKVDVWNIYLILAPPPERMVGLNLLMMDRVWNFCFNLNEVIASILEIFISIKTNVIRVTEWKEVMVGWLLICEDSVRNQLTVD